MDPITIIILVLLSLTATGATGVRVRRKRRRARVLVLRDAIRSRGVASGSVEVSVFDVFWDLGVSEYALEIMGNQGLLMRDLQDLPVALDNLSDLIKDHGGYDTFIRETNETIQEFYEEHRRAGNRREIPALTSKPNKTLPLPAITADDAPSNDGNLPVPYTGVNRAIVARNVEHRMAVRTGDALALSYDTSSFEIDLDEVTRIKPVEMIKGMIFGKSLELERWWEMKALRDLREELDMYLRQIYQLYATQAQGDPTFYEHLYDAAKRWDIEAKRIDDLLERDSWKDRPWNECAEALILEAAAVARQLAYRSKSNIDQTIELIHSKARKGDAAMAGYLVFLNHQAFFAGRGDFHSDHVRRIETTTYRIQQELRTLAQKRVI